MKKVASSIVFFLILKLSGISQEIGTKYQGGIVVAPGIIIHSTLMINSNNRMYFNFNEANDLCKKIKTEGYTDWRVPTIVDLEYINRFAQDNRDFWGGYPQPIKPGTNYLSSSTKKESNLFGTNEYRYMYLMISDETAKKLNKVYRKTLGSLDDHGYLLPVRYFR